MTHPMIRAMSPATFPRLRRLLLHLVASSTFRFQASTTTTDSHPGHVSGPAAWTRC